MMELLGIFDERLKAVENSRLTILTLPKEWKLVLIPMETWLQGEQTRIIIIRVFALS